MLVYCIISSLILGLSFFGKLSRLKMVLIMRQKPLAIATLVGMGIDLGMIVWAWLLL